MTDPTDPVNPTNPPANPSPTEPPAPTTQSIVNPDGSFTENWYSKYPSDFHPTLSRFKNFDEYVTSSMEARRRLGHDPADFVEIPKDSSSDEVRNKFWQAAGKPEKPDGYEYKLPKELEQKINIVPERMTKFKELAHEINLTKSGFQKLLDFYHNDLAVTGEQIETDLDLQVKQKQEAGIKVLEAEFGEALMDRTNRAEGLMTKYGQKIIKIGDEEKPVIEWLEQEIPNVKTSPWIRLMIDEIAEDMAPVRAGNIHQQTITTPTSTQIDERISEIRKQLDDTKLNFEDKKRLLEEKTRLYKLKNSA